MSRVSRDSLSCAVLKVFYLIRTHPILQYLSNTKLRWCRCWYWYYLFRSTDLLPIVMDLQRQVVLTVCGMKWNANANVCLHFAQTVSLVNVLLFAMLKTHGETASRARIALGGGIRWKQNFAAQDQRWVIWFDTILSKENFFRNNFIR